MGRQTRGKAASEMKLTRVKWIVLTICSIGVATAADAGELLSASAMSVPFRSVAASRDVYALRYNPAGMAFENAVELAYIHQFTDTGPGGDNSLMLRAKALAFAVNWIKNRGAGKRREYLVGAAHPVSPRISFGTTFSYFKADDPALNDKSLWTHSLVYSYSPMLTAGFRWENPWHTKVNGESTMGMIVGGVSVRPPGLKLAIQADYFYPDDAPPADSYLRGSALLELNKDIDLAGYIDTDGRFGVEFRLLRDRSAGGVEVRGTDHDRFTDGSFYVSVLNRKYRPKRSAGTLENSPPPLR